MVMSDVYISLTEFCLYMHIKVHSGNNSIDEYMKVHGRLINIIFTTLMWVYRQEQLVIGGT